MQCPVDIFGLLNEDELLIRIGFVSDVYNAIKAGLMVLYDSETVTGTTVITLTSSNALLSSKTGSTYIMDEFRSVSMLTETINTLKYILYKLEDSTYMKFSGDFG